MVKFRFDCCAHTCAARRICACQTDVDHLALKVAKRLLETPPKLVPSGSKLIVTRLGCGQALPLVAYSTTRASNDSTANEALETDERRCFVVVNSWSMWLP